ncbi:c-type cytochrome [Spirosoma soli]|uniref:C-type cytochrome n=1 Tax=Spirosoma soli TaxID=1770529 RepID=A0ABW5M8R1_9BACT
MNATRHYPRVVIQKAIAIVSAIGFITLLTGTGLTSFTLLKSVMPNQLRHVDTTISVYGPYRAIKLPITKGVKIANPIQVKLGPQGVLYAANQTGEVYSLRDTDQDGLEDMAFMYCNVREFGLRSPSGFAHRGDTIYVGTAQQIRAFLDTNKDGKADTSWVVVNNIPHSEHPYEWTTGLCFGPDGWLYFALSTDSWNAAPSPDPNGYRGAILRVSPDGKKVERVATGIRSVYGMSFNGQGDLFFTDNEGGGNPKEELNRLVKDSFYGHNPSKYAYESITAPVHTLETETAPSSIEFNRVGNDFGGTGGNLFIAFYGPGERWTRGGVSRIQIERLTDGRYTYKEFPVADIPKLSGLAFGKDGSLYLANHGKADYWYNAVYENQGSFYKLVYDPTLLAASIKIRKVPDRSFSKNSVEAGKQLFAERACLGCHQVDGITELLGPNLKDVASRLTRAEILEEILKPSARIKPSMMAVRVTKKDGTVLIGRVVNSNEHYISLMLIGNQIVQLPRQAIEKTVNEPKSLMYEGLLTPLTDKQREALLDYLVSLSN